MLPFSRHGSDPFDDPVQASDVYELDRRPPSELGSPFACQHHSKPINSLSEIGCALDHIENTLLHAEIRQVDDKRSALAGIGSGIESLDPIRHNMNPIMSDELAKICDPILSEHDSSGDSTQQGPYAEPRQPRLYVVERGEVT